VKRCSSACSDGGEAFRASAPRPGRAEMFARLPLVFLLTTAGVVVAQQQQLEQRVQSDESSGSAVTKRHWEAVMREPGCEEAVLAYMEVIAGGGTDDPDEIIPTDPACRAAMLEWLTGLTTDPDVDPESENAANVMLKGYKPPQPVVASTNEPASPFRSAAE
jgi:hypothetical protein